MDPYTRSKWRLNLVNDSSLPHLQTITLSKLKGKRGKCFSVYSLTFSLQVMQLCLVKEMQTNEWGQKVCIFDTVFKTLMCSLFLPVVYKIRNLRLIHISLHYIFLDLAYGKIIFFKSAYLLCSLISCVQPMILAISISDRF